MKIETKDTRPTTTLDTRFPGDIFTFPDSPRAFYIVIEPDYGLRTEDGVYCVDLESGELYCLDEAKEIIPVEFSATASF